MVKRWIYILCLVLFISSTFSMKGEDSTFVFHIDPATEFFYKSYSDNADKIKALTELIQRCFEKIEKEELGLAYCGPEEAASTVKSFFMIYEGLKEEYFIYTGEETATEPTNDIIVEVTLYKTDYEPESVRRVRKKSLKSMEKVNLKEIPKLEYSREGIKPWREQFSMTEKPAFALKTNILALAAMTPNIKVEIPIARHFSIAAEYYYGWWLRLDNTFCWQIQTWGAELKYWINPHDASYNKMGKWYVGAFYNMGLYDFQFDKDHGVQGDFNLMTGVIGGYAHEVAPHVRFEFSFGGGVFSSVYQEYITYENIIIKNGSPVKLLTVLPKAEISLVYVIYKEIKKGGAR